MDTKFSPLVPGTRYTLPDSKMTVVFGPAEDGVETKASTGKDSKALVPADVPAGTAERGWVKACKVLGAGMGTGLSWSFRPLMAKIATETLLGAGVPPKLATAMGLMLSELVINPPLIAFGTTTAELISNRIQRLFTSSNVAGPKSPDFAKDLGEAIGVGFTTMAFALAYQGAGKTSNTFEEVYYPALLGGALTGAMAALTAMMGKDIRQLDAMMQDKQLQGKHDLVIEGPGTPPTDSKGVTGSGVDEEQGLLPRAGASGPGEPQRASCGKALCERLKLSSKDQAFLTGFFKDRLEAAFEMNREMVLNFVPVIGAQIVLAYVLPMMNPAKDNILGLQDHGHWDKQDQYRLVSALATALVHNKRVEGWTSYLTGAPTKKADLNHTDFTRLARQLLPALVNGCVTLGSAWITHNMVTSGTHHSSVSSTVHGQMSEWSQFGGGSPAEVQQVVGGMLGALLLLRLAAGSGDGLRMREMVASGVSGALMGATGSVDAQAGAAFGAVMHSVVQPTHALSDITTPQGRESFSRDGVMGYGRQVLRPVKSMAQGAFHAITKTRSLLTGAVGGGAGGILAGGTAMAAFTMATGGLSVPAILAGSLAVPGGSLLATLAAYSRRACSPDTGDLNPRQTVELTAHPDSIPVQTGGAQPLESKGVSSSQQSVAADTAIDFTNPNQTSQNVLDDPPTSTFHVTPQQTPVKQTGTPEILTSSTSGTPVQPSS